ncbi:MAG: DAK2 domain-containing protein [Lachnospiraceae bacterium]|nr:DAK2 domain-containing protein [Lachnospiraceae bacterium]
MFLAGAKSLESKKEWINELNVFPVPDGDTGTNMTMTIMSAAGEVVKLQQPEMPELCKAISSGSLRGARGNSGVILSQLLRGFTKAVKESEEIDIDLMATACEKAVESAYKAVMKPKEGTILTVAKGISLKARALADEGCDNMQVFIEELIKEGDLVLSQTPELLPVLKQAGVVDSGGQGLMEAIRGAYDAFMGKEIDYSLDDKSKGSSESSTTVSKEADIKYGYCTEFIIMLNKNFNIKQEMDFKAYLESIGDSIVVVADDNIVKVHVHTDDPGMAIQKGLFFGQLSNIKIDNMRLENLEKIHKEEAKVEEALKAQAAESNNEVSEPVPAEKKPYGFVAVSVGAGLDEIFGSLGVDTIISGGQTMNPSTEDIVNAIKGVNADTVFVLPNNKNIILAANQAQYLVEDKTVVVIPTKTIAQGITAIINFVPDLSVEDNTDAMTEEIGHVKTGEVTYAVRDTVIDDKEIRQGDFMGIGDSGILAVGADMDKVVNDMVAEMVDDDTELISIYYGEDVTEEDAARVADAIKEQYSGCDVEVQMGGQPIYYYIISAE